MIPRIVHIKARSKDLPWEEKRLMKKNQKILDRYDFDLRDDADDEKMVKEFFPRYYEKYMSISKPVAKVDVAKAMYMYIYGGWYIDTDYKFFKDPEELPGITEACVVLPVSREMETDGCFRLGYAIVASEPKQRFWIDYIEEIFAGDELADLEENRIEKVTGSEALTAFYLQKKESGEISQYPNLMLPERKCFHAPEKRADAYGIHFCWGSWRTKNLFTRIKELLKRKIQAI